MRAAEGQIEGLRLLETRRFTDTRGYFFESWNKAALAGEGIETEFVQDNISHSGPGVLRGLHLQAVQPQGKLVRCLKGAVFDVAVDVRPGSPSFGLWAGYELSEENGRQLWIPGGLAHGFLVLGEEALLHYKCTDFYAPKHEQTLIWNDAAVGIEWPLRPGQVPVLSPKDGEGLPLSSFAGAP